MKKRRGAKPQAAGNNFFHFSFFFFLLLSFSACTQRSAPDNAYAYGEAAIRLEQALACSNTYLGISFTVPRGWWLRDLNTANFSPDPADTADNAAFDIIYGENSPRMDLISFANLRSFGRNKHLGFEMSAEYRENPAKRGNYLSHFEGFIPSEPMTLVDSGAITIGSATFEKQIYEIPRPRNNLRIIALSTGLKTGYFLHIQAAYWAKNKKAETRIIELINKALILE